MSVLRVALLLLLVLAAALPAAAQAPARHALLIGNQAYTGEIGALTNPHNDVALLEAALKTLGFTVTVVRDARLGATNIAINRYLRTLSGAGPGAIGFFYYSGHGAADGATNYLIPVDATSTDTAELWDQSLRLGEITRRLKAEAGNATHFVVFDACRNTLKLRESGNRTIVQAKGFRAEREQPSGMLISYATAEGELASDIGQGAGPYAKVLAEEIVRPGVEAVTMFRNVQRRVRAAIRQEPYLGFNALGDVYFAEKEVARPPIPQPLSIEAAQAWAATKDTISVAVLESFARRYKDTVFAEFAQARIAELNAQSLARTETDRAIADTERNAAALSMPPLLVGPGSNASGDSAKEVPLVNPTTPAKQSSSPTATSSATTPIPLLSRNDLVRQVQRELKRVGCFDDEVDGEWGARTQRAAKKFAQLAKTSASTESPTEKFLLIVSAEKSRICPTVCSEGKILINQRCVAPPSAGAKQPEGGPTSRPIGRSEKSFTECVPCCMQHYHGGSSSCVAWCSARNPAVASCL